MVPPLKPPRTLVRTSVVSVSSPAPSALTCSCSTCTPMSEGTESNPHECTMRAPVERATSWFSSALARANTTSPVRST
jgi:hypothetical protein